MKHILITNADAHTFASTYYSLQKEFDCHILSSSRNEDCPSGYLTDLHFSLHAVSNEEYATAILNICKQEQVDVVIPLSIEERLLLLTRKDEFTKAGVHIISVDAEKIELTNDKLTFAQICKEHNIPMCQYEVAKSYVELKAAAQKLGYPKKKVIIKPVFGSGSRGFRILNSKINYKTTFYSSRPDQLLEVKLSSLRSTLGEIFAQPIIVSEFLPGVEYTVDCLKYADQEVIIPRERLKTKNGLTDVGRVVNHPEIIRYTQQIISALNLTSIFGFQFKLDEEGVPKILECNPRIQGTMIMSTLAGANIIAEAVKRVRGFAPTEFTIDWDLMFYRINSGFSIGKDISIVNIIKRNQIAEHVDE